jgi:hypothetical protein
VDDRGLAGTPGADTAVAVVHDDRPRRLEQPRLRRPALWSLAISALSLPALLIGALGGPTADWAYRVASALAVAGGILACVWLVRLQWLLARSGRLTKLVPDSGMWVMWALPFVSWVLPAVRISRLEKAAFGSRSWVVLAWAALFFTLTTPRLWALDSDVDIPTGRAAWLLAAIAVVTFALWSVTVLRLTRGAEVVSHETGVDA